ncbi:MAG TPA: hypothetical protein VFC13_00250 [Actinomycetes bacterium]|nr:hypothetical protein [Actinomycetes bacterium]
MNAAEKQPVERKPGSAEARRAAVAAIGAGARIGVAVIAAALSLLFEPRS